MKGNSSSGRPTSAKNATANALVSASNSTQQRATSPGATSLAPSSALKNLAQNSSQQTLKQAQPPLSALQQQNAPLPTNSQQNPKQSSRPTTNGLFKKSNMRPASAQPTLDRAVKSLTFEDSSNNNNNQQQHQVISDKDGTESQNATTEKTLISSRAAVEKFREDQIDKPAAASEDDATSKAPEEVLSGEEGPPKQQEGEGTAAADGEAKPEEEVGVTTTGVGADSIVVFSNEKELRDHFAISHKIEHVAGILVKVKRINDQSMENLLYAIGQSQNIVNLKFEESIFTRNAATHLANFMKQSAKLDMLGLIQVRFEDIIDHKKVLESISMNSRLRTLHMQQNIYYDHTLSEFFEKIIKQTKHLHDIDFSWCDFRHQLIFYSIIESLDRSKIFNFKLRGFQIGKVEGKILQKFINDSKTLQSLDLSHSYGNTDHFEFIEKFGQFCYIKRLSLDCLETDLTPHFAKMGESLGLNHKLEHLSMRELKAKTNAQVDFWKNIRPNRHIQTLNLEKCRITDRVLSGVSDYLMEDGIALQELNLTRNPITGKGLIQFSLALGKNRSLTKLTLARTDIEDEGLDVFAQSLAINTTLEELSLAENHINNQGMIKLSGFLRANTTLKTLDISKNEFGSPGMTQFCIALQFNGGLTRVNFNRNKDVNEDETGIRQLANCIQSNSYIHTLDLSSIRLPKPILKSNFLPALQDNIFIQNIVGKFSLSVIADELADNAVIEKELVPSCLIREEAVSSQFTLNLRNRRPELLKPALKLIRCQCLETVDLTCMQLTDDQMKMLATFLSSGQSVLKRLVLTQNVFITDYGMILVIEALRRNNTLQHLSILGCTGLTNLSLETMHELVRDQNMTLFKLDLDQHDGDRLDTNLAMEVVREAFLNKSIQRHLKPRESAIGNLKTIEFEADADIAEHFDSVIKCWRIMRPQQIDVTDSNLTDDHTIKLSNLLLTHLAFTMQRLILRRNKIGDNGAEHLAKFIAKNEKQFTYLEISRNNITQVGCEKMLNAMMKNTRITTLLMDFGNKITRKQARKLDQEVKANNQIGSAVKLSLVPDRDSFGRLSILDKGPEFLRAALKSVSELSILYLELSDNLLTYSEAKKICKVLVLNPQLRVLNLSKNLLDGKAANEISKALKVNSNLLELDLSQNKIGDQGVSLIVLPIAKQKLRQMQRTLAYLPGMGAEVAPLTSSFESEQGSSSKNTRIRIMKLALAHNDHTEEALKHVYALLLANKDIVVEINNPKVKMPLQQAKTMQGSSPNKSPKKVSMYETVVKKNPMGLGRYGKLLGVASPKNSPSKAAALQDKTARLELLESTVANSLTKQLKQKQTDKPKDDLIKPVLAPNLDDPENGGGTTDMDNTLRMALGDGLKAEEEVKIGVCKRAVNSLTWFCCGKAKEGAKKKFFLLRIWEDYKRNKEDARMFKCNERILSEVESISQRYITIFIYLSAFFFYLTALLIPMTEKVDSCTNGHEMTVFFYYAIYAVLSGVSELVLAVYLQRKVDDREALEVNKFHLWKIVSGQLGRADFFTDVLFMMQVYSCGYWVLLSVGVSVLIICSFYQIFMLFKLLKKDHHQLLENIERNCKLAYVTEHQALAVILDSFSLSNFESVGKKTITIPKIISSIKCFTEDLPQFTVQVVFILFYSGDGNKNQTSVVLSILLGLFSFGLSISHALHAKTSNVDISKVEKKIESRFQEKNPDYQEKSNQEQEILLSRLEEQIKHMRTLHQESNMSKETQSFLSRLAQVEHKRSCLINGLPSSADGGNYLMAPGEKLQKNRPRSAFVKGGNDPLQAADTNQTAASPDKRASPTRNLTSMNFQQKQVAVLNTLGTNMKSSLLHMTAGAKSSMSQLSTATQSKKQQ